ncbi:MAG: tRNA epoxyqueuosine(34) reductase QueG, partial [Planctomycetes bacterium]|nr:tRNA epoxyqueuosine(34) reductase QueG [Planctomycetota bacterium]
NGLLINEQMGSWFLLGEIVTDLELDYDEPAPERCGSCRRCLDACPTRALVNPYELDSRKCISYLTIESRKEIPKALAEKMGDWVFGCDVCQDVCPYNRRAEVTADSDFQPREKWARIDPAEVIELDDAEYQARFSGSAITRAKREHMAHVARNCIQNRTRVFSC